MRLTLWKFSFEVQCELTALFLGLAIIASAIGGFAIYKCTQRDVRMAELGYEEVLPVGSSSPVWQKKEVKP